MDGSRHSTWRLKGVLYYGHKFWFRWFPSLKHLVHSKLQKKFEELIHDRVEKQYLNWIACTVGLFCWGIWIPNRELEGCFIKLLVQAAFNSNRVYLCSNLHCPLTKTDVEIIFMLVGTYIIKISINNRLASTVLQGFNFQNFN